MKEIKEELLKKYYYKDKISLAAIARECDVTVQTIRKKIEKLKFEPREKLIFIEDLAGVKINKLTFVKYVKNDKFGKALWNCKCECGREKMLNASAIKANLTTSCGCNKQKSRKGVGLVSGAFWRKLERSALSRDMEFTITIQEVWDIFLKQSKKCALSGVDLVMYTNNDRCRMQTASPDRIDSSKGYTVDNFQWVHKRVNRLKNILSTDELLFWTKKIHNHNCHLETKDFDTTILSWD